MDYDLLFDLAPLCLVAFFAGFVDAMVGGGGMIQLPALFLWQPHLSLAQTLATNKMASFLGTCVSAIHYSLRMPIQWKRIGWISPLALVGGLAGAYSLRYLNKAQFLPVILVLLILVYLIVHRNRQLGLKPSVPPKWIGRSPAFWAGLLGLGLGYYEGLIGPGTGSLMVIGLVGLGGMHFLSATAHAKIINGIASLGALILFFSFGQIYWILALPMSLCNMAGNYLGSRLAMDKGSSMLRRMFQLVMAALILRLGYAYFWGEV